MRRLATSSVFVGFVSILATSNFPAHGAKDNSGNVSAHTATPILWGSLERGSYHVGFQRHFVRDPSRTWEGIETGDRHIKADLGGRPIEFNLWFPAAATKDRRPMLLADYYLSPAPSDFQLLNAAMERRFDWNDFHALTERSPSSIGSVSMAALRNARPAAGRFPLVLMFGALGDDINANVVMAEYLASHGLVVVSISLLGPSDADTEPSIDRESLEATVRDMEYALSIIHHYYYIDPSRIASVGHSIGAVEALLLAMRNSNVSTVVGLDGTYGFKGAADIMVGAVGNTPDRFRGALLDIRRAQGIGAADLDFTVLQSLRYSERWQVTLTQMQHEDFTSRAETGAWAFHNKDMPLVVQHGKEGYEFVCGLLRRFLAHQFTVSGAAGFDAQAETQTPGAGLQHWAAERPPGTTWTQWTLAAQNGLEAITAQLWEKCGSETLETCAALEDLQRAGGTFDERGQLHEALVVSQAVAWARPRSVFAQDALANAEKAVGDRVAYRQALQRAIELIPMDPRLAPEVRPSFEQMEQDKLERLPP